MKTLLHYIDGAFVSPVTDMGRFAVVNPATEEQVAEIAMGSADDANLDDQSGGLLVWDVPAPRDWDFSRFSIQQPAAREFLVRNGARSLTVPYRANRAAIFDSELLHKTDTIRFRDGYENRRINITLLYGERGAGALG